MKNQACIMIDGEKIELNDIPELPLESIKVGGAVMAGLMEGIKNPIKIDASFKLTRGINEILMFIHGLKRNNWRRLHGLPMIRRVKRR